MRPMTAGNFGVISFENSVKCDIIINTAIVNSVIIIIIIIPAGHSV